MSQIFSFQYLTSNRFSETDCEKGFYCAHINVNDFSSFDEACAAVMMRETEKHGFV